MAFLLKLMWPCVSITHVGTFTYTVSARVHKRVAPASYLLCLCLKPGICGNVTWMNGGRFSFGKIFGQRALVWTEVLIGDVLRCWNLKATKWFFTFIYSGISTCDQPRVSCSPKGCFSPLSSSLNIVSGS